MIGYFVWGDCICILYIEYWLLLIEVDKFVFCFNIFDFKLRLRENKNRIFDFFKMFDMILSVIFWK